MKKLLLKIFIVAIISLCYSCAQDVKEPAPFGPLPSERQLAWHDMEYYGFIHFNMNTFTNIEWGNGSEKPSQFNPTALDAKQWAKTMKDAGMKGVIITAKHHDGFCLWPSKYTEHSVKNSPWKDGKGDLLKDLTEACKEYGLKVGMYLSPWDRNHADYGKPEYITYFYNQLRELLTNYGDIFEVWFDGANGGSGYYGGANETRKIDNKTYYQWDKAVEMIRELQPNAVIFGDGGPGVRWVGNEEGWANETNWSLLRRDEVYPGYLKYVELRSGHEDGTHWVPAECDVSIRPGWYYHPYEDHKVKTLSHLMDIYYQSVGRNASLLLNLPVDNRGLVHEKDREQLEKMSRQIKADFSNKIAISAEATNVRGDSEKYAATKAVDDNRETYWATDDSITNVSITLNFKESQDVNRLVLQEYIKLGQRVKAFNVQAKVEDKWIDIDSQTTIGYKRILRFKTVNTSQIRINITDAKAAPVISNIEMYNAPKLLALPVIERDKNGMVNITAADEEVTMYYTLDGTEPSAASKVFNDSFLVENPTTIKAVAYDSGTDKYSEIVSKKFDISKKDWKVISVSSGDLNKVERVIDGSFKTSWTTSKSSKQLPEIVIDLGKTYNINGFTYVPMQDRWMKGVITNYKFFISKNKTDWKEVSSGEFGNIWNNPIEQKINFKITNGRYIKFKSTRIHNDELVAGFAEIGILTK